MNALFRPSSSDRKRGSRKCVEKVINGRPAYMLDVTPRPGYTPRNKRARMFSKVAGKLWVDKQDFGWPKADGRVIEPFFMGFLVARVQAGG